MGEPWTPRTQEARRISGRLLRAHRASGLELRPQSAQLCVEGLTRSSLPTQVRRKLGALWALHGPLVLREDLDPRARPAPEDEALRGRVIGSETENG